MKSVTVSVVLVVGALLFAVPAHADEGFVMPEGGTVSALAEHPTIRLVAEYVHIDFRRGSNQVECVFFLENVGPATTVTLGFPTLAHDADELANIPFNSFVSYVDGDTAGTVIAPDLDDREFSDIGSWLTKSVHFDAGQTRCVRDVYEIDPEPVGSNSYRVDYILWTGATWAGSIGVADIVATFESISIPMDSIIATPAGYHRSGNECRWHFTNFEPQRGSPEERIGLCWRGGLRR